MDGPAENGDGSILPLRFDAVTYAAGGNTLLGPLSFEIARGPRTIVLGPNGAGKSLTLRLGHGLLAPAAGTVRWRGPTGAAATSAAAAVSAAAATSAATGAAAAAQAMVFQRPMMLRRSALANVVYALALRGVPRLRRRALAGEALAKVGLAPLAARPARVLSVGEQQRLALARAWVVRPQVLFLDEPTANLDPAATQLIESIIGEFHAAGCKIVMTTHDLAQARRMADEVLLLHRGLLLERGGAKAFFAGPATAEAQAFLRGELAW